MRRFFVAVGLWVGIGCQGAIDGPVGDGGGVEGAPEVGVVVDLGLTDLGSTPIDLGTPDAEPVDGSDLGPMDAMPVDLGRPDLGPADTGMVADVDFVTRGGAVVFEAEHFHRQLNNERIETYWVRFEDGVPDPEVSCVTDTPCTRANRPACNEHPNCDGDRRDPAQASGGTYLEALPDRRRTDDEANTGELGVVNNTGNSPILQYRVRFDEAGRYYVWCRAFGQGPAANGLHVGLDGQWPRNELTDAGPMRLQFPGGWRWTQNRRGGQNHTGVPATAQVGRRDANVWLEIDAPGIHVVELGMREDGLELDKCLLSRDPTFEPNGLGPPETRP